MKRLETSIWLACATVPTLAAAQPPPSQTPPPPPPVAANRIFPTPVMVPGQPIETRPPELSTDKPAFPGQTRAPYRPTAPYQVTVLTDQLKAPWALAFLPDSKMLVTERAGAMRIVDGKGTLSAPLGGVPKVSFQGQVGLLDVVVDPKFGTNHRIFFMYCEPVGQGDSQIVVARATLDQAAGTLKDLKVIFRAKPALPESENINAGGRIAVARDGNLFAIIGDRSRSPPWDRAQQLDTHLGKMVHITPDGAPVPGNPFASTPGALPEIWSLGHRSEEGLAFDPQGRLWETEHGPRGGDELNLILPGKNYGWPVIVHGIDYPGEKINGGLTEKAGMEQPRYYWDPVIAPSGLAFYNAGLFPQWKGSVLVGALRGVMLDRLTLSGDKVVDEEPLLVDWKNRIRDVRVGPEGAVYVLTDQGRLMKLTPK
ncbi:MAG TPA: PQQ-dependent sugar dehydrogenase [Caulobacteraceae bacterium]|jgi:glucose/arabinose dehydrogenase|nr:PQQ-dependent sugar dehydrogenase [Caulobacteraceae bacterium]